MLIRNPVPTALLSVLVCLPLAAFQDDGLRWFDNYKEGMAEAVKTGRPIFLEYRCEP